MECSRSKEGNRVNVGQREKERERKKGVTVIDLAITRSQARAVGRSKLLYPPPCGEWRRKEEERKKGRGKVRKKKNRKKKKGGMGKKSGKRRYSRIK